MTPSISTIIPFCDKDKHLVKDAIDSILAQSVPSLIFVVGDNVSKHTIEKLTMPYESNETIFFFRTPKPFGPYCIANSIVRYHTTTDYIAIQDADDISYEYRFDDQIGLMKDENTFHSSGPMKHSILPGYTGDRHLREPTLLCGPKASNVPLGRFINGTRMIQRELFEDLNGFPGIFCSGDICFDNTVQFLGIKTSVTKRILGERRLHPDSLTNHPSTSRASETRDICMQYLWNSLHAIRKSPTMDTAREIGGLNQAPRLEQIC